VTIAGSPRNAQQGLYASASLQESSREVIVKAVNSGGGEKAVRISLGATAKGPARAMVLASGDLKAENSLDHPLQVAPVERAIPASGSDVEMVLPAYSLTVVRVPIQ
jgi:alpha-L-arabinofuranosidase